MSGIVECGCCGAAMNVVSRDYLACSAQRNSRTCENRRTIRLGEIEERILAALEVHLLEPDVIKAAIDAYRIERELGAIARKIKGLVTELEEGRGTRATSTRIAELEAQEDVIRARMAASERVIVHLHPYAADQYRQKVAELRAAIRSGADGARDSISLVRALLIRIVVTPEGPTKADPQAIEIAGDLAALLRAEGDLTVMLVAGAGFEPTTFRL